MHTFVYDDSVYAALGELLFKVVTKPDHAVDY